MLEPARDQIEMFVDAIFRHAGSSGFVAIRSFFEDGDKPFRMSGTALSGGFRFLCDVAEDDARRAAQNPKPVVFCPPLATFSTKQRAREQDLMAGLALSVECDEHPQQARGKLEALIGAATVVVKSGGRWTNGNGEAADKLHLHWRLAKPAQGGDLAKLKQTRDLAARIVGGDPSNKPVCHPIRWPGSWHRKAEPRLCEIETLDPDREIDLDAALAILMKAAPGREQPAGGKTKSDSETSDDWAQYVADIVSGKSFHAPLVVLAARLVGSGTYDGSAVKLLRALMEAAPEHDALRWQSRYDSIPRIVSSAREKYADDNKPKEPTTVFWHGESDYRESRPYLVQGIIPEIGCGLISGQWGTYKTFIADDLAHCIMGGGPFLGNQIMRRGGVLFIALEGSDEVAVRLQGVINDRSKITGPAPFAWTEMFPPLLGKNAVEEICKIAGPVAEQLQKKFSLPLVLIVIDTLIAAAGYSKDGQENDAAVSQAIMSALAEVAKRLRCFVFGIDHFGKTIETGTRGSSAKEGRADVLFALLGDRSISGEITNTRLALRKRRGGRNGEEFPFQTRTVDMGFDQYGQPMSTLVIDWGRAGRTANAKSGSPWPKSLQLFRRVLVTVIADHGRDRQPFSDGPVVRACDLEIVRREFYRQYVADGDSKQKSGARRKAFRRAVVRAQELSLIATRGLDDMQLIWLTQGEAA
jgi:hypothetical protein